MGKLSVLPVVATVASLLIAVLCDDAKLEQTNLLFIMYDDLRPELSIYGRHHMITPNFERLAARSVVFDNVHAQIAVCNPSRDSLLTGLRPDTTGTYAFQSSFRPHLTIPTRLAKSGYTTASYGKLNHWESEDKNIWSHQHWDDNWYKYQVTEAAFMNSTVMPDRILPEEEFRDYIFASRAIETLKTLHSSNQYFMLAVGFKMPHLALHVPYKYYDMYKNMKKPWALTEKELRFPPSSPSVSYRCCADFFFSFMESEGAIKSKKIKVGNINDGFTNAMHDELMIGYSAAITFADAQLGRMLDAIDQLELWGNLTVVLTADHGMHNGEKGIWEKWSLFDESTRVPLLIAHPLSPYKGQHNTKPVELIDVFPTINDILGAPKFNKNKYCKPMGPDVQFPYSVCHVLQGKSLVSAILGNIWDESPKAKKIQEKRLSPKNKEGKKSGIFFGFGGERRQLWEQTKGLKSLSNTKKKSKGFIIDRGIVSVDSPMTTNSVQYKNDFSITQSLRCSPVFENSSRGMTATELQNMQDNARVSLWTNCDRLKPKEYISSVMGYSLRSKEYRYTAWFHFDLELVLPKIDEGIFEEELYDHSDEKPEDFTHRETVNLVYNESMAIVLEQQRERLISFMKESLLFRGPFK